MDATDILDDFEENFQRVVEGIKDNLIMKLQPNELVKQI